MAASPCAPHRSTNAVTSLQTYSFFYLLFNHYTVALCTDCNAVAPEAFQAPLRYVTIRLPSSSLSRVLTLSCTEQGCWSNAVSHDGRKPYSLAGS
jgi:hypothetical protein